MECYAKIYLKFCKCIYYYLPRFHDDITICGLSDYNCTVPISELIQTQMNSSYMCDCLPGCFEIIFDTEVSMAPLLRGAAMLENTKFAEPNVSILHIFYKNNFIRSQKKEQFIGFTEFLCMR